MHKPPAVRVSLSPSRHACVAVAILAAATACILALLPIHPLLIVLSVVAVAGWPGNRIWVLGFGRAPRAILELRVEGDRSVAVTLVSGEVLRGQVQDASDVG